MTLSLGDEPTPSGSPRQPPPARGPEPPEPPAWGLGQAPQPPPAPAGAPPWGTAAASAPPFASPPRKGIPRWAKILIAVVSAVVVLVIIAIIALAVFVNSATSDAEKVSNALVADIQADNPGAAYQLTTPAFRQADSEAQVTQLIQQVSPALQGSAKVTGEYVTKTTGQPELAIIAYNIHTTAGTRYLRVVLQHNQGWQVRNFRASPKPLSVQSAD